MSVYCKLQTFCKYNSFLNINQRFLNLIPRFRSHYVRLSERQISNINKVHQRQLFTFKRPSVEDLKVSDNIPPHYQLIYRSNMETPLLVGQILTIACATIICIFTIITEDYDNMKLTFEDWHKKPEAPDDGFLIYITAFLFCVVIILNLISKLPFRIYSSPDYRHYAFILHGNLPLTRKILQCKLNDVRKVKQTGVSPWKQCTYQIKDQQKVILLDQHFRRPADLNIMIGDQKPSAED